ncbi:hypothetical protein [Cyanobium sp. CH-040]|uniref:hypothetical protein n=1 Tax=Cyanobium sp. CH-040 TaxID=2823708 RepID=UPI0020CE8F75|nr:hypothetical protein [Cyanobium sp. CH-040]MCP9927950.1 hypothetical protein [Cyanobium sp. CH-040]
MAYSQESGDELYQPVRGQDGKNVIWIPTSDEMVKEFGARGVGIESNPDIASLAMPPGTRVVSHSFAMGDWKADAEIRPPDA